jgi:hypothetical protein
LEEVHVSVSSIRLATAALSLVFAFARSTNADTCLPVEGFLEESLVTTNCASPVGLCTVAQMFGHLKGRIDFVATDIIASADTPTTSVVFVTGDSVITNAQLGDKRGTVTLKDAAAYETTGDGNLVDIQTITSGTNDFAGATGRLRISGSFSPTTGTGTSKFEGQICVP